MLFAVINYLFATLKSLFFLLSTLAGQLYVAMAEGFNLTG